MGVGEGVGVDGRIAVSVGLLVTVGVEVVGGTGLFV